MSFMLSMNYTQSPTTYEIEIETSATPLAVTLTEPTGLELLVSSLRPPECLDGGGLPQSPSEEAKYETFIRDVIEFASDVPREVVDYLPATSLAKLIHACANVIQGHGPRMDEFDHPAMDDTETDSVDDDSHALSANAYPHFETYDD